MSIKDIKTLKEYFDFDLQLRGKNFKSLTSAYMSLKLRL